MSLVFLLDVDNTLLDNDRLKSDLSARIEEAIGPQQAVRFWEIYEQVREEESYVDYPETIRRMASELDDAEAAERLADIIYHVPFRDFLYPGAIDTVAHLNALGEAVILSDGDPVYQPLKIRESGLEAAVSGRVMITVHKEDELPDVFDAYPADHYVAVDDKPRILSALETCCPTTFTTVFVLQGKYAETRDSTPKPDYIVEHISDLERFTLDDFRHPAQKE